MVINISDVINQNSSIVDRSLVSELPTRTLGLIKRSLSEWTKEMLPHRLSCNVCSC